MLTRIKRKLLKSWFQSIPNGLISIRYILPWQSENVKHHKSIWWASKHPKIPRIIWILEQTIYWLRWVLFSAWYASHYATKYNYKDVKRHFGISYAKQLWRCITLSTTWCIPPHQLYDYEVIQRNYDPLSFIYNTEAHGWHAWLNQHHRDSMDAQKRLADKVEFASEMHRAGIPTIASLPQFSKHLPLSKQLIPNMGDIFCKLRSGSRATGAFEAGFREGAICGVTHSGNILDADDLEKAWFNLCAKGDVIVQPCLRNHEDISAITNQAKLATLRIITQGAEVTAANISLPIIMQEKQTVFWMDIDPKTGFLSLPENMYPEYAAQTQQLKIIAERAPKNLPYWDLMCTKSLTMHQNNFDLWAIAWDWAITPEGPFILEGNAGWGPADWQLQNGAWFK